MRDEAKITSKGRVTIPRTIRRILRVAEGDTLIFETTDDGVWLRPRRAGNVRAFAGACRVGTGKTVAEIVAETRGLRGT